LENFDDHNDDDDDYDIYVGIYRSWKSVRLWNF